MNFFTRFEHKYLALTLFSLTFIFGYVSPYRTSKKTKNDTSTGKNVHSRAVRLNKTSFHNPKKTSNFPRVELPISGAKPKAAKTKLETARLLPTDNNCVVVFDIDGTICITPQYILEHTMKHILEEMQVNYTECPKVLFTHSSGVKIIHTFLPYLHILFDYLLENGARIAFFSMSDGERNEVVIPDLLKMFWGSVKYEALRAGGQFAIHSEDDALWKGGNQIKDLRAVQRDGETLSEIILVDDSAQHYGADDQQPCINARSLSYGGDIVLNSVYYMLGLFRTYFENEGYRKLPIKIALSRILPNNDHYPQCACRECDPYFVRDMIGIGLSAVQRLVPNATLYQRQTDVYHLRLNFTRVL